MAVNWLFRSAVYAGACTGERQIQGREKLNNLRDDFNVRLQIAGPANANRWFGDCKSETASRSSREKLFGNSLCLTVWRPKRALAKTKGNFVQVFFTERENLFWVEVTV